MLSMLSPTTKGPFGKGKQARTSSTKIHQVLEKIVGHEGLLSIYYFLKFRRTIFACSYLFASKFLAILFCFFCNSFAFVASKPKPMPEKVGQQNYDYCRLPFLVKRDAFSMLSMLSPTTKGPLGRGKRASSTGKFAGHRKTTNNVDLIQVKTVRHSVC